MSSLLTNVISLHIERARRGRLNILQKYMEEADFSSLLILSGGCTKCLTRRLRDVNQIWDEVPRTTMVYGIIIWGGNQVLKDTMFHAVVSWVGRL